MGAAAQMEESQQYRLTSLCGALTLYYGIWLSYSLVVAPLAFLILATVSHRKTATQVGKG